MDEYSSDLSIDEVGESNSKIWIILIMCVCLCCIIMIPLGAYYYMSSDKKASNQGSGVSTKASKNVSVVVGVKAPQSPPPTSSISVETKSKNVVIPAIPGIGKVNDDESLKALPLDCTVKLENNNSLYTCTHPDTSKVIKLVSGPVFKLSYSEEVDAFKEKTYDYYIIVPFAFIVDFIVDVSLKEIEFTSLNQFLAEIKKVDQNYESRNSIPDKCLSVPMNTRAESKPPYNTTCIFFPGFTSIGALVSTLQKTFIKEIPENILREYYNMIDAKVKGENPELTVFEYVMYVASMNTVNNTKYRYFGLCDSEVNITC